MPIDPPLTYKGALQVLGKHDRPWLDALDAIAGGFILGSALAAPIAAAWNWVDQKNEATSLLRRGLDVARRTLLTTRGHERQHLIIAAHTTIVVAAFFEAFEEAVGKEAYRSFQLTSDEKLQRLHSDATKSVLDRLYRADVPMPSCSRGFDENLLQLESYIRAFCRSLISFLRNLANAGRYIGMDAKWLVDKTVESAIERYRSHFLNLAVDVPEFSIFMLLTEHAASRAEIRSLRPDLAAIIDQQGRTLTALERLLSSPVPAGPPAQTPPIETLHRANMGVLREAVLPSGSYKGFNGVRFPSCQDIYITPRFRAFRYEEGFRPAEEDWWENFPVRADLDIFLAEYFGSYESSEKPLLVLGHPGAGKSLFTKVLAARLPIESYVAVRVSLRRVDADASVFEQIEQALRSQSHGRLIWSALSDGSSSRIRVVLLDGFDELIQASGNNYSGYLREIAEFQRREADQERPVAVVVTSRTIVADRARVPLGSVVMRLEDFDDHQISDWLDNWHEANQNSIQAGVMRPLLFRTALRQRELARQPLLLLMLALYHADPASPGLKEEISRAELYGKLIEDYVRREVSKERRSSVDVADEEGAHMWYLAIAAFAMFNRGRQNVLDEELGQDLAVLTRRGDVPRWQQIELAKRAVGRFFFVHGSHADEHQELSARSSFEFLHATFGEYLIARRAVELVTDLVTSYRTARRTGGAVDDGLLLTLLSHSPLAVRLPVIGFVRQMRYRLHASWEEAQQAISAAFEQLRSRENIGREPRYNPMPYDRVRELAVYTANLAVLLVALGPDEGVMLSSFVTDDFVWKSTVRLWWSGLDGDGWAAQVKALDIDSSKRLLLRTDRHFDARWPEVGYAQLVSDRQLELVLYAGYREISARRPEMGSDR